MPRPTTVATYAKSQRFRVALFDVAAPGKQGSLTAYAEQTK